MTTYKTRKNRKMRGSKTHGWGAMKKHRGAGSRGGRGMAGTGKRGDAKKPSIWKDKKYFGKHGFKRPKKITIEIKAINLKTIEQKLESLLSKKLIEKKNDFYAIDLKKLGFNKLLSTGKITKKFSIKCEYASKKAIDKIKKAGGSIILEEKKPKKIKEKPKEEKPVAETAEKVEEKPIAQKAEKIETKEKEVKK
ncbi:MAG: uL15 family ribosomal protein [Nanoarchaeota archaeon]|nr:uL15 family ribosomal protein [Nanoarchaeota archaeon]